MGLAGGRREVIPSTRGGSHSASETLQALNHQEIYLRTAPYFRGGIHVGVVRAEDLQLSEERPAKEHSRIRAQRMSCEAHPQMNRRRP